MALSIAYGLDIKETDDSNVKLSESALENVIDVSGSGTYLVDILPILRHVPNWFPGAAFQKEAKAGRKLQKDFRHLPYEQTIENIVCLSFQNIPHEKSG